MTTDDNTSLPSSPSADTPSEPLGARAVSAERLETLLARGDLSRLNGSMLWGSNYAVMVVVRDPQLEVAAVYKPQRGERPLWDFPDGTLCFREVAAYWVSKSLGWHLVPPTVLRQGPHGLGSVQFFVEHDPQMNYFSLDDRFVTQLQRFAVFDYLVNNTDRKGGHLLLDPRGKLWGIDHGLTFHTTPKLRTVIWEFKGLCVPDDLLRDVQMLAEQLGAEESEFYHKLLTLISQPEIAALRRRMRHVLDHKRFPMPGPGPNHPWPPI
jgi:hypothetical protein